MARAASSFSYSRRPASEVINCLYSASSRLISARFASISFSWARNCSGVVDCRARRTEICASAMRRATLLTKAEPGTASDAMKAVEARTWRSWLYE